MPSAAEMTSLPISVHQKGNLYDSRGSPPSLLQGDHRFSSNNASSVRSTCNSELRPTLLNSSSKSIPSSTWARRAAPPMNSIGTNKQRSQLLRSISHLHINAQQSTTTASDVDNNSATPLEIPFTRFDLIQPPEYQAKIRKSRGWSFSDDTRRDLNRTVITAPSTMYNASSSTPNTSQLSLSLSPKITAQGKAKAVAAATKIKKQFISSKPSTISSEIQTFKAASTSSRSNADSDSPTTMPKSILTPSLMNSMNQTSSSTASEPFCVGTELERQVSSSSQLVVTTADWKARQKQGSYQRSQQKHGDNCSSNSSMIFGHPSEQPSPPLSSSLTNSPSQSESVPFGPAERARFHNENRLDSITSLPLSTQNTKFHTSEGNGHLGDSSAATPITRHQQIHQQQNLGAFDSDASILLRHGDNAVVVDPLSSNSSSYLYRAPSSIAPLSIPNSIQGSSRDSRISFDCSQKAQFSSSEIGPSQTDSRRPSSLAEEESADMADIEKRNISSFRRGSAPTNGTTKIKSTLKQGMMRLTGSTIDLNNFESENNTHPGAHLERRQADEDDILASPLTPTDSPPRSRFSFSLNRRRSSQEAVTKATSTFSLLSKFNKSRDALEVTTVDVDNEGIIAPATIKGRKSSDASIATRQFLLKALRRPSRSSIPEQNLPPRKSMQISKGDESASFAPNQQRADTIFASAFGSPQKSDVLSAQAFESTRSLMSGVDESQIAEIFNGQLSRNRSASRRVSQDSGSTSFFSIVDSPSHADSISRPPSRFRSPFGNIPSHSSNLASHAAPLDTTPSQEEEGPLGEHRQATFSSNDVEEQQQQPFFESRSREERVETSPLTSSLPGASTNVSPSEQGSHLSRSTAPSSTQPSDLMTTAALYLETERGTTTASKQNSLNDREVEISEVRLMRERIQGDGDLGQQSNTVEDSHGSNTNNGSSSSNGTASNRRTGRSSRLLHLPRLNSMNIFSGASGGGANGGGEDGNGGDDQRRRGEESMGVGEEHSSDTDSTEEDTIQHDEDGSETDSGSETEISIDSEAETSIEQTSLPADSPSPSSDTSPSFSRGDNSGIVRPRPAGISLPPKPIFISTSASTTSPAQERDIFTGGVVGMESWQQFASDATPLETPGIFTTPRPSTLTLATTAESQRMTPAASSNRTPKAPAIADDNSYFDLRPTTVTRTGVDNQDMPPPSPSIITRSRAASSASRRSTRSSNLRDFPPVPPMTPQILRGIDVVPSRTKSPSRTSPIKRDSLPPLPSSRSNIPTLSRPMSSTSVTDRIANEPGSSRLSPMTPFRQTSLSSSAKPMGRPSLYQQQSQSLIDLSTIQKIEEPTRMPTPMTNAIQQQKDRNAIESGLQTPTGLTTPGGLRRRRSMFEVGAQPPPYAVIHSRPEGQQMIFPREEEGKEALPKYLCSVHIEGYLPRKMEFSSPGMQAKDRSWRRQYFVLHGTCLKVYKTDLSGDNLLSKGVWGDVDGVHVHREPMNEDGPVGPLANGGVYPKEGSSSASINQGHSHSHSIGNSSSSSGFNAAVEAVSALKGSIYNGSKTSLIKTYSLQGAESGLAADYLKRRHVVRVRVEGEQFLLQTRNDRHVVDWIEAFQAATNVALDLERRPMPKFITLPRRRRRRRREGAGADATDPAAREEAEIQEAQRRSIADAQSAGIEGRRSMTSPRHPPARPLGLPGDESPIPSAAFDDMLREEHEGIFRQDASDV